MTDDARMSDAVPERFRGLDRFVARKSVVADLEKIDALVKIEDYKLSLGKAGKELVYTYDTRADHNDITKLLDDLAAAGIELKDLQTTQSSLEEIFVGLVSTRQPEAR